MTDNSERKITINVLGYREDGDWCALALEMDLRGYGATFEEAQTDLLDLIAMQVSFALHKDDADMMFFAAEDEYWRLYAETKNQIIRSHFQPSAGHKLADYDATELSLPEPHVIDAMKGGFVGADA